MATRAQLRDRALGKANGQVGVKEVGKPNHGPEVERYLASVGLPPGQQWCAAFVYWCYNVAAKELGLKALIPRTGKVATLWEQANGVWRSDIPTVGAIFCHLEDPADPRSPGHCGLVVRVTTTGRIETIEGNTNAVGSRVGDRVRVNERKRSYVNLGYIDIGRLGPEPAALLS